ncbi:connectin-like [Galleria mellonella]|uniref:Connectin-like n=1 Tax=Galleria mellonella TaxID=7137 RepID=A0ABM3MB00_GALME|nr:connectin-like [Galleria mellonella]
MESVVQYLLLALVLTSVQISYTESKLTQRRDKSERRYHAGKNKDNICEITDRASKVHCYCESTEIKTARRADCWVFNGGIEESDPIWSSFNSQPFLERLAFNVRSDGALKFIPLQVIHHLKRLQKLSIHYATFNKIEKKVFHNMTTVREIILMNDKITELDFSSFVNLPLLVNLTIKENKITEIQRDVFVDLPSLKNLDLSFNNINLVYDGCFEHLTTLNDLTLESNLISVLTKDVFRGLANLTRLDLRSNKLSAIGDLTFTELWNLNELLLDNNELKYLSERAFDGLVLLQKLSMTGNKLTAINEGLLEGVRGLELLDLRNNEIVTFTYDTIKPIMDNLKLKTSVLYLSGNKLRCDCRLIWIQVLRNETTSEPLKSALDDVTCMIDAGDKFTRPTKAVDFNDNTKTDGLLEIISNSDVLNQEINEDEGVNRLHKIETTVQPFESQLTVVNIPVESLSCANKLAQNSEDSLMLSSKDESYWKNSSFKLLSNLYLVSTLLLSSILY